MNGVDKFYHVAQSGVDSSLRSHGVGTRGEQLGNHGGLEALHISNLREDSPYILRKTHGGTETRTSSSHHNAIVLVIHYAVIFARTTSYRSDKPFPGPS